MSATSPSTFEADTADTKDQPIDAQEEFRRQTRASKQAIRELSDIVSDMAARQETTDRFMAHLMDRLEALPGSQVTDDPDEASAERRTKRPRKKTEPSVRLSRGTDKTPHKVRQAYQDDIRYDSDEESEQADVKAQVEARAKDVYTHEELEAILAEERSFYLTQSAKKGRRASMGERFGEDEAHRINNGKPFIPDVKDSATKPISAPDKDYYNARRRGAQLRGNSQNGLQRQINVSTPEIRLKGFAVEHLMDFVEKILDYEEENKMEVSFASRLTKGQVETMSSYHDVKVSQIKSAADEDIMEWIEIMAAPLNRADFTVKLTRALKAFTWTLTMRTEITLANYYVYHTQLKRYLTHFQQVYYTLAKHVQQDYIPALNTKPRGLIATLVDCEPEGRLRKFIETENINSSKSMDSFILTMLEIMKKLYDQSLTHKRSNEYFRQPQKAKYEEKDVESKTPRKPFFAAHKQAVNNVSYQFSDYEDEYDSEDFDAFGERRTVALERNNPRDQDRKDFLEPPLDPHSSDPDVKASAEGAGELNEVRGVLGMQQRPDTSTLACFKAMTEGVCRKRECTYSHDRAEIAKQAAELIAKLSEKPWTKVEKNREPPLFTPSKPSYPRK